MSINKNSIIEINNKKDVFSEQLSAEEGYILSRLEKPTTIKELILLTGFSIEKILAIINDLINKELIKTNEKTENKSVKTIDLKESTIEKTGNFDIKNAKIDNYEAFIITRITGQIKYNTLKNITGLDSNLLDRSLISLSEKQLITIKGKTDNNSNEKHSPVPKIKEEKKKLLEDKAELKEFKDEELIDIFSDIYIKRLTGFLRAKRENQWKIIFFVKGNPVYVVSNMQSELLGNILVSTGVIDKNELTALLDESSQKGIRFGELIVIKGIIDDKKLKFFLRKQVEFKVINLFSWNTGSYLFSEDSVSEIPFSFELNTADVLYKSLIKFSDFDKSKKNFEDKLNFYLTVNENSNFILGTIDFDKKEKILLEIIREKSRMLREIISLSPLMITATYKTLYALVRLSLFKFEEASTKNQSKEDLLKQLKNKHYNLLKDNYFKRLVLHESTTQLEIEENYNTEKKKYNINNYPESQEIYNLLKEINNLIDEAYNTIKDKEKRDSYRKEIFSTGKLLFEAGVQYDKGELAMLRENFKEAYYLFDSACELAPGEPVYFAAKAVTQYIYYKNSNKVLSTEGKNKFRAMLKNYSHNEKILFYGFLLERIEGNIVDAAKLLKTILTLNPENKEAQKAMEKLRTNQEL